MSTPSDLCLCVFGGVFGAGWPGKGAVNTCLSAVERGRQRSIGGGACRGDLDLEREKLNGNEWCSLVEDGEGVCVRVGDSVLVGERVLGDEVNVCDVPMLAARAFMSGLEVVETGLELILSACTYVREREEIDRSSWYLAGSDGKQKMRICQSRASDDHAAGQCYLYPVSRENR